MLAVTQYEVYVLQHGRWTVHARYTSEERKEAILDARTTEIGTGFPTKVMKETYFPDLNDTEIVTAYISPKAKEHQARRGAGPLPARAAKAAAAVLARRRQARVKLTP